MLGVKSKQADIFAAFPPWPTSRRKLIAQREWQLGTLSSHMCHLPHMPCSRPILTPRNPRWPQAAGFDPTLNSVCFWLGCSTGIEMGEDFVLSKLHLIWFKEHFCRGLTRWVPLVFPHSTFQPPSLLSPKLGHRVGPDRLPRPCDKVPVTEWGGACRQQKCSGFCFFYCFLQMETWIERLTSPGNGHACRIRLLGISLSFCACFTNGGKMVQPPFSCATSHPRIAFAAHVWAASIYFPLSSLHFQLSQILNRRCLE